MGKGKLTLRRRKRSLPQRPPVPQIEASSSTAVALSNNSNNNNNNNDNNNNNNISMMIAAGNKCVGKKKPCGTARLWMRFDRTGQSELIECDKSVIIKRVSIPARDLRILGPIFCHSSSILAREKAMVVNLEFIRAIITAEEVLLLDPLRHEVLPFVDQLRQQLPNKGALRNIAPGQMAIQDDEMPHTSRRWLPVPEAADGLQAELPFEFQVLEIALQVVCTYLDSSVAELERVAYPVLDNLAINVSSKNLERVRSLKSNLTRLLARVQKVRDEIEHLLDDNEDMAQLYLTRKWIYYQQSEILAGSMASNNIAPAPGHYRRVSSTKSGSLTSNYLHGDDVEDLEMLLEAYFMQLDGTRNKILSVREYIDDTEDYVNIQLDNQRNELIQLQLTLTIASFAVAVETLIAGIFGMNIPFTFNEHPKTLFWPLVVWMTVGCILIFLFILGYARWKKLLGS